MPSIALVNSPKPRWLPPILIPLFLLWPLVPVLFGVAWLMSHGRSGHANALRMATRAFCQMRGLEVNVDAADGTSVRIKVI